MDFTDILGLISGETGVIALLLLLFFLLVKGTIVPKGYLEELKDTNKTLSTSLIGLEKSVETLTKSSIESLETSKTALRVLQEARKSTGVKGDDPNEFR